MNRVDSDPSTQSWKIMLVLMLGIILSPLNVTFTSVALPTMRNYFSVNIEQATWIGTAYFIPSVAFMPFQTYIGERWGVRRIYALGSLVLSAGAFLAAAAPNFRWLLVSRVLQGMGWSALYPLALILIRRHYPSKRQGEMMGLWESAVGFATIVAPPLAGGLVEVFGWRILYIVVGVVASLGALLTPLIFPPKIVESGPGRINFDWFGALSLTLALTSFLVGITQPNALFMFTGFFLSLAWIWQARRQEIPFVPPGLFSNGRFMIASLAANLRMLVAIAALTALPLFFEDVQGIGPAAVGSLMVIYSLFLFFGAWPGGRWADKSGVRVPGIAGYAAMSLGILLMLTFDVRLNILLVTLALTLRGIGAGLTQAPYAKAAVESAGEDHSQSAAGLYGTLRYSGLALGTALVGLLLQARLTYHNGSAGQLAALAAYRELWLVLTGLSLMGLVLTLMLKGEHPVQPVLLER